MVFSYEKGKVSIPNKELMNKFTDMLKREPSLGYVHQLAKESEKMLKATLAKDTDTMQRILEFAHNTECMILELKVDHSAEEAVQQIKERQYALRFAPKMGESVVYTGKIMAVGIAYDRKTKKHECIVEEIGFR